MKHLIHDLLPLKDFVLKESYLASSAECVRGPPFPHYFVFTPFPPRTKSPVTRHKLQSCTLMRPITSLHNVEDYNKNSDLSFELPLRIQLDTC